MASSNAIIQATRDTDLRERAIAIASSLGIENPEYFVNSHLVELALAKGQADSDQSIADILEYSRNVKAEKRAELEAQLRAIPTPGGDLSAVTDDHLRYALNLLRAPSSSS